MCLPAPETASLFREDCGVAYALGLQTPSVRKDFDAATCPVALDLTSSSRRAPAMLRVPQHRTPSRRLGGLWR
jgi:hypothetical protein